MTEAKALQEAIKLAKEAIEREPNERIHHTIYSNLVRQLRATFHVVTDNPQYVYSPSRAVLKRVQ